MIVRNQCNIYKFPFEELHKVISVKTRCEKVIEKQKQLENEKSIKIIFDYY